MELRLPRQQRVVLRRARILLLPMSHRFKLH